MSELIREIWRFVTGEIQDELRIIWARSILRLSLILIAVFILATAINLFGFCLFNLIIMLGVIYITLILPTHPSLLTILLLYGVIAGAVKEPETIEDELKKAGSVYRKRVIDLLKLEASVLFFLGIWPLGENPWAAVIVPCSLIFLWLLRGQKGEIAATGKKWVIRFVQVVLIVSIISTIPGYVWNAAFGHNFSGFFKSSEASKALGDMEEQNRKNHEVFLMRQLKPIQDKLDQGIELSNLQPKEQEKYKEIKEELTRLSLPALIKSGVEVGTEKVKKFLPVYSGINNPNPPKQEPPKTVSQKPAEFPAEKQGAAKADIQPAPAEETPPPTPAAVSKDGWVTVYSDNFTYGCNERDYGKYPIRYSFANAGRYRLRIEKGPGDSDVPVVQIGNKCYRVTTPNEFNKGSGPMEISIIGRDKVPGNNSVLESRSVWKVTVEQKIA